jgi:hypothetical protein
MRRREFLSVLGSTAAWPQQTAMPVVGYLNSGSAAASPDSEDHLRPLRLH